MATKKHSPRPSDLALYLALIAGVPGVVLVLIRGEPGILSYDLVLAQR
jgi:hypothetical protein